MKKFVKMTESDIKNVVNNSIKRILREDYGLEGFEGLSDDEYNDLIGKFYDDQKEVEAQMADDCADEEYEEPIHLSDNDLYRM